MHVTSLSERAENILAAAIAVLFGDSACVNYQRDVLWCWLPAPTRSSLSLSGSAFTFPLEHLLLSEKANNSQRTLSASKSSLRQNPLERPAVACRWRRRRETFEWRARRTVAAVRTWLEGCFFFSLPQLACRHRSVIGNSCFIWERRALNIAGEKIFYRNNSPDRPAIGSICKRRLLPVHVSSNRSKQEIELSQCTAHWL